MTWTDDWTRTMTKITAWHKVLLTMMMGRYSAVNRWINIVITEAGEGL